MLHPEERERVSKDKHQGHQNVLSFSVIPDDTLWRSGRSIFRMSLTLRRNDSLIFLALLAQMNISWTPY